jgi:hypothetical protein
MKRWVLIGVILGAILALLAVPVLAPEHRAVDDPQEAVNTPPEPVSETPLPAGAEVDQTGYVKGFYFSYNALGSEEFREHAKNLLETTELNAIVMDFKGDHGYLSFPTQVAMAQEIGADKGVTLADPTEFMQWLKDHRVYTIARIVAFKDDLLSKAHPELAVTDSSTGGIWKDGEGLGWADPNYHAAWDYNVALAEEAAKMGFDEVQFDYVRFPSDGSIGDATYAMENTQENRTAAIAGFLKQAKNALAPHNVKLAADTFGYTAWVPDDLGIGQHLESVAPHLDVISPMVYPSTYSFGLPGESPDFEKNPVAYPYEIVNRSTQQAVDRAKAVNPNIEVRPWIQDFQDYAFDQRVYTPGEIRLQMDGARDAGGRGWLLWDPAVAYTPEALVSATPAYAPNPMGSVLVLQYQRIAEPEGKGQRTPANLRADLEQLLASGYYPVNLRDLVDNRLSSVPAGKRPIVLTFDGSTEDQFRLLPDGTVDPNTAMGVLKAFHEAHGVDWPLRATFCVSPFSEDPGLGPFGSQELSAQKLSLLEQWGLEVAAGLEGGRDLSRLSTEDARGDLAAAQARLRKWLPNSEITSLCLTDSGLPKDTSVLAGGESTEESYAFKAVTGTVKGLAPSPRSSKFDPYRIPRVQATQAEIDRSLKLANQPSAYYVSPGE